jgi:vancomycin resistance protein YoaR
MNNRNNGSLFSGGYSFDGANTRDNRTVFEDSDSNFDEDFGVQSRRGRDSAQSGAPNNRRRVPIKPMNNRRSNSSDFGDDFGGYGSAPLRAAALQRPAPPSPRGGTRGQAGYGFGDSFGDEFDDEFSEQFGGRNSDRAGGYPPAPPAQRRPAPPPRPAQKAEPPRPPRPPMNAGFDGFDDEFGTSPAPKRRPTPPPPPVRTQSSRYDDELDDFDDFGDSSSEPFFEQSLSGSGYGGDINGDGFEDDFDDFEPAAPLWQRQESRPRETLEDFRRQKEEESRRAARATAGRANTPPTAPPARSSAPAPNGAGRRPAPPPPPRAGMPAPQSDMQDGQPQLPMGIPQFYAQFFGQDDVEEKKKSKRLNAQRARRRRVFLSATGIVAAIALVFAGVGYYSLIRVKNPLMINSAILSLGNDTTYQILKSSVDNSLSDKSIKIDLEGTDYTFNLGDYDFGYAAPGTEATSSKTYTTADGEEKQATIETNGTIEYNHTAINDFLTTLSASKGDIMKEYSYKINEDKLVITAGKDGIGIEFDKFINQVIEIIRTDNYSSVISPELITIKAPPVDIDAIYKEVKCAPADARSTTDGSGEVVFIDHVVGKNFNLEAARDKIDEGGTSWTIQLTLTQPKLDIKTLKAPTCPDLLSTFSTKFSTTNKPRTSNIKLAAEAISAAEPVQPTKRISFNNVVGERTAEKGYSEATVYTNEGADSGLGGGICQVSSTFYYACIKANLAVYERHNHGYTVSYMPTPGTDATVSYPWPDCVIINDKDYPIRIKMYVKGDTLTAEVWGTADGESAVLTAEVSKYIPYKKIYKRPVAGKTNQSGQQGYTVISYRTVYKNGKFVKKVQEHESSYRALNSVIYTDNLPAGAKYS